MIINNNYFHLHYFHQFALLLYLIFICLLKKRKNRLDVISKYFSSNGAIAQNVTVRHLIRHSTIPLNVTFFESLLEQHAEVSVDQLIIDFSKGYLQDHFRFMPAATGTNFPNLFIRSNRSQNEFQVTDLPRDTTKLFFPSQSIYFTNNWGADDKNGPCQIFQSFR